MKYILSEEEFKNMVPIEKHQEVRNKLLDVIEKEKSDIKKLKAAVLGNRPCYDKGSSAYCDGCPLGFENLDLCEAEETNYSK